MCRPSLLAAYLSSYFLDIISVCLIQEEEGDGEDPEGGEVEGGGKPEEEEHGADLQQQGLVQQRHQVLGRGHGRKPVQCREREGSLQNLQPDSVS